MLPESIEVSLHNKFKEQFFPTFNPDSYLGYIIVFTFMANSKRAVDALLWPLCPH